MTDIQSYKAFWDTDNHGGRIILTLEDRRTQEINGLNAAEFAAVLLLLNQPNPAWHEPSKSVVKQ